MRRLSSWSSVVVFCVCLLGAIGYQLRAGEAKGELKFAVQLIWGTNEEKPPGKDLKEVDPRITEALKGIFKWKNYFEVTRKNLAVASKATEAIPLLSSLLHPDRWLLILGVLFVLSVYFFPAGIVGKLRSVTRSTRRSG